MPNNGYKSWRYAPRFIAKPLALIMRKQYSVLLLLLFPLIGKGQNENLQSNRNEKSYFQKHLEKLYSDLSIQNLENSELKFHFRLINTRHITEIKKNSQGRIKGRIVSFIERLPDSIDLNYLNNQTKKHYIIKTKRLNRKKSKRLFNEIQDLAIHRFANDAMPRKNNQDVGGIFIENAISGNYEFKEFWIPNDSTLQSKKDIAVLELISTFNEELDYNDIFEKLIRSAPAGCYDLANGFNQCK